jgi:hydrogenase expression/formation protein HypE
MVNTPPASLPPGKVPARLLQRFLAGRPACEGEVVGPGIGLDGAVLRIPGSASETGGSYLVAASDPITFTATRIGWYVVHVNANDVACMGARPTWFLATLLLPEGATSTTPASIAKAPGRSDRGAGIRDPPRNRRLLQEACDEVGASLVGGHTEITPDLARPMVAGTMLGVTHGWVSAEGAEPGDALLLTKGIAVEGTAILATDAKDRLAGIVPAEALERARSYLREPGISVVADAFAALGSGKVHALHDPTEGGLSTGIHELCQAGGTGAVVELESIPILRETLLITQALELDPLGLLASGALLIAAPESEVEPILAALEEEGIPGTRIGRCTEQSEGVVAMDRDGRTAPLTTFSADELTRVL